MQLPVTLAGIEDKLDSVNPLSLGTRSLFRITSVKMTAIRSNQPLFVQLLTHSLLSIVTYNAYCIL